MGTFVVLLLLAFGVWAVLRYGRGVNQRAATVAYAAPAAAGDFSMLPEQFIVFDLETTGLNAQRDKIIEIGALRVKRSDLAAGTVRVETFNSLVKIKGKVPAKITELTGITSAMLERDGVELTEALTGFLSFIQGDPLVAFNATFDMGFMTVAMAPNAPLRNRVSCALAMARRAFPGQPNYRLSTLARSVDAGTAHRSVADCHRALVVYVAAAQRLRSHG